ncbi:MAG TPA: ChaN family lipoprotein [Thermodesulfobacteriota bacterium]|nr:ChaN family lipoprotein [Thermodesulfobacteriota bacterium]
MTACATAPSPQPLMFQGVSRPLKPGDIIETATGSLLSFEEMLQNLTRSSIIYAGEVHSSPEDHRIQLSILKGLYGQDPSLVLAMEMFPREVQPLLDQYSEGRLTEGEFLQKVNWEKNWGFPFDLYRGILHWARARKLKIIGLNAPKEVVEQVAKGGLNSLSPTDRDRLAAEFHPPSQEQREYLEQHFARHPRGTIKDFETFFQAQRAWEETMAETLARAAPSLTSSQHILVLIGKGHMAFNWGVPRLTLLRIPSTFRTVLPIPLDYPIRNLKPTMADYLYITE